MMMFKKHFRLGSRGHGDMVRAIGGTTATAPRTRHKSRIAYPSALVAVVAISLPLLGSTTSAVAATPRKTPPIGKQLAELKGPDSNTLPQFGTSVAISGTTAVVGATGYGGAAGLAFVFTKTATGWKQTAVLKGSDIAGGDRFGASIAISGTIVVVGAPSHGHDAGRAYLFTKTATGWKQAAELKAPRIVTGAFFGSSVTVSGRDVVVGAPGSVVDRTGRAYVFTKTATGWKQVAQLKGSDTVAYDEFGHSVAVSGTTVVVSATDHADGAGRVYVFVKSLKGWTQVAELKGSDTVSLPVDEFGWAVAVSGTTVVVGSPYHAGDAGRAYVFSRTTKGWKQVAELRVSDAANNEQFGFSVAVSGATAVVGAVFGGEDAGRAYVFRRTAKGWALASELKGSDTVIGNRFGISVDVSGTIGVVGAPGYGYGIGRAYVFEA
jgi:hypothetical protein